MTITALGSLTVGDINPGAANAVAAGQAGISGALPDLTAKLTALASFTPTPVDFAAQLSLAQQVVAGVQLAITAGISPPSINTQIAEVAAQIGAITAQIAAVNAQLSIIAGLAAPLSVGGIRAWAYSGQVGNAGGELGAELAAGVPGGTGPTQSCNALIVLTTSPAAWSALSAVLKVTP